jgi:hypothetical protein
MMKHLHHLSRILPKNYIKICMRKDYFNLETFCVGIINVDGRYLGAIRATRGAL